MALPDQWRTDGWQTESGQTWVHRVRYRDERSAVPYALKILKNPARRERFAREVRTMQSLAKVQGASVPEIVDHDLQADRPWFAMPWYSEGSLQDVIEASVPLDIGSVLARLLELSALLDVVHRAGVAHRDLKPANILIAPAGGLVLADFGLCLDADEQTRHTTTREAIGSRWYIAPENENGMNEDADQRPADFYAFGKLAWALALGRNPLARESIAESRNRVSEVLDQPEIRALDQLIADLIIVDPNARLHQWDIVEAELRSVLRRLRPAGASEPVAPPTMSDLARRLSRSSAVLQHQERQSVEQRRKAWILELRKVLRDRSRIIEIPLGDFNRELQGALSASATTGGKPADRIIEQQLPDVPRGDQTIDPVDEAIVWILHSSRGIPDFPIIAVRAWTIVSDSKIWLAHTAVISDAEGTRAAPFLPEPLAKGCVGPFPAGRQSTVDDLANVIEDLAGHFIALTHAYIAILADGGTPADPEAWAGH